MYYDMRTMWLFLSSFSLISRVLSVSLPDLRETKRTEGGIHVPLYRRQGRTLLRRGESHAAIGFGDFNDNQYSILLRVGGTDTTALFDTGSADLWVVSDACTGNCTTTAALYPQASFQSTGLDIDLRYGDSRTGTHASGLIGKDTVSIAGLSLNDQSFAAINETTLPILTAGVAGVFGAGFPQSSEIWTKLFANQPLPRPSPFVTISSFGPFFSRLDLASPMFSVTLQRETVEVGGNVGLLSIGELPAGVKQESLTWANVRKYTVEDGGVPAPPEAADEVYPLSWEIMIDDVYFDGNKLPRSNLTTSISLSGLVDTGSSLVRGPADVVQFMGQLLGGGETFPCATPHTLAFQIGGQMFPIDPRDFIRPTESGTSCGMRVVPKDEPSKSSLHSWSLGDPFLKGVLAAFYFGNVTHPSVDAPKIGFLSTVPSDADQKFKDAVGAASAAGNKFPLTSVPAPSGTVTAASTLANGVQQASAVGKNQAPSGSPASKKNGGLRVGSSGGVGVSLVVGFGLAWGLL